MFIADKVMGQNCPNNTNYSIYGHTFFDLFSGAKGSRASRPNQKVGPLGGTFGTTVTSKNVLENLGPETPLKRILIKARQSKSLSVHFVG